jgi:hypothetical protein
MFHVYLLLAYLYLLWRFVLQLSLFRLNQILVGAALLLASKHHLFTQTAFGSMFSPEVPSPIIVVAGWTFGSFLFLLVLLMDVFWVILAAARLRAADAVVGGVTVLHGSALGTTQSARISPGKLPHR